MAKKILYYKTTEILRMFSMGFNLNCMSYNFSYYYNVSDYISFNYFFQNCLNHSLVKLDNV